MQFTLVRQQKFADILAGIGHVLLASVAIPYFIDRSQPTEAIVGLMSALAAWMLGVIMADKL